MRPVEPALLGLLRHCWDQNWLHSLPPASLQTVAVGSALALEEYGCTLLALEALQVNNHAAGFISSMVASAASACKSQ